MNGPPPAPGSPNGSASNGTGPAAASTNGGTPSASGRLRVWIDQDLCTGDGLCTDHAPSVFTILEDGIAYCVEGSKVFNDPGGSFELAVVPVEAEADVVHAASDCPGECIFLEFEELIEIE
ncbi:MAG: ferredoxin [Acidimicrobiales bacterium]